MFKWRNETHLANFFWSLAFPKLTNGTFKMLIYFLLNSIHFIHTQNCLILFFHSIDWIKIFHFIFLLCSFFSVRNRCDLTRDWMKEQKNILLESTKAWQSVSTLLLYFYVLGFGAWEKMSVRWEENSMTANQTEKLLDASLPLGTKLLVLSHFWFFSCFFFLFLRLVVADP